MNRSILYQQEQGRSFDFVSFEHDVLLALGYSVQDLLGSATTMIAGGAATQTTSPSLVINIAAMRVYQQAAADAVAVGAIAQDTTQIEQQGFYSAGTVALVPPATAGQSQWNLIQAQFSQSDVVRASDPNGGIPPFYNAANPSVPLNGQGGLGQISSTERSSVCIIEVVQGAAASTGSEVPPSPTSGWVPLYLIDLTNGQTQITNAEILPAGPSVGTNVPSNYQQSPFLAGLLNSHHGGIAGQAPKIKLGSAAEVQGVLPYANMSPVRELLTSNLTLYVNAATGSDSNNGLSSGSAFATLQHAWNVIQDTYDLNGYAVTVNVSANTYTAGLLASGAIVGGSNINFVGSAGTIVATTNAHAIQVSGGAALNVSSMQLQATGSTGGNPASALVAINGTIGVGSGMSFGATSGYHMWAASAGEINCVSENYSILGGATYHYFSESAGLINIVAGTITLSGTPGFGTAFAGANLLGLLQASGSTYSGSASGPRYSVILNSVINTNGGGANYFPGSSAGSYTAGGQYA